LPSCFEAALKNSLPSYQRFPTGDKAHPAGGVSTSLLKGDGDRDRCGTFSTYIRVSALGPEPVPHPDDVIIDYQTGAVRIDGPVMEEQKEAWDKLRSMWPKLERELMEIDKKLDSDPNNLSLRTRKKELTKMVSPIRRDLAKRGLRDAIRALPKK